MHKIAKLKKLFILSQISLILLLIAHIISGDKLLFHSDFYSLFLYLSALTLIITIISSPILLIKIPQKYQKILSKTIIWNILIFWLLIALIQINNPNLNILGIIILIFSYFLLLIKSHTNLLKFLPREFIFIVCLISILQLIPKSYLNITIFCLIFSIIINLTPKIISDSTNDFIKQKIENLGAIILLIISLTPIFAISNHINFKYNKVFSKNNQHLVLIVLDAFPAELLNSYNKKEAKNDFDNFLKGSLLFKNIYSFAPYTYGFFGTLYNGLPCSKEVYCKNNINLMKRLERSDVNVNRMSFYTLGTPEGSAIRSSDYKGLRSYFITENNNLIPRLLGINYHIFLSNIGENPLTFNKYGRFFYYIFNQTNHLNPTSKRKKPNIDFYLNQLEYNIKNHNKSFTIIHTRWNQFIADDWRKYKISPFELVKFRDKTKDFQYEDQHEHYVQNIREESKVHLADIAKNLQSLITKINSKYQENKPTIIITADHGKMMSQNRYDYIWHPQEGAIHTLLAIINGEKKGEDKRYFNTIDLHTSILDFFDIGANNGGISMFQNKERHKYVTTITNSSDKNKEWFIVISTMNKKYQINIHPKGNGEIKMININEFDESSFKILSKLPNQIQKIFDKEIDLLKDQNIHQKFLTNEIIKLTKP